LLTYDASGLPRPPFDVVCRLSFSLSSSIVCLFFFFSSPIPGHGPPGPAVDLFCSFPPGFIWFAHPPALLPPETFLPTRTPPLLVELLPVQLTTFLTQNSLFTWCRNPLPPFSVRLRAQLTPAPTWSVTPSATYRPIPQVNIVPRPDPPPPPVFPSAPYGDAVHRTSHYLPRPLS